MVEYLRLLERVLAGGASRQSRAGPTLSCFGLSFSYSMRANFPLVTTREMRLKPIAGELAAFLSGTTELAVFKNYGCHYWDANAKAFAGEAGTVGKIYGYQWRYWNGIHDQIAALLHGLRDDPDSRRHLLTTWNPTDLPHMCLPPCHVLAQFYVDGAFLDMAVTMRSVDLCLGLPADMALYGLLLALVADEVGRTPGRVTWFLGDAHIYENHLELVKVQLKRRPYNPPRLRLSGRGLDFFRPEDAALEGYDAHPAISYQLNV